MNHDVKAFCARTLGTIIYFSIGFGLACVAAGLLADFGLQAVSMLRGDFAPGMDFQRFILVAGMVVYFALLPAIGTTLFCSLTKRQALLPYVLAGVLTAVVSCAITSRTLRDFIDLMLLAAVCGATGGVVFWLVFIRLRTVVGRLAN
jgi:hypothetical protein